MAETEKITINIDVVDLGKIDLLVEQGFYSNRTDLIKSSIRQELQKHEEVVSKIVVSKSYNVGVTKFSKEELEEVVRSNKILDIKVLGLLIIAEDVSVELAKKTIKYLNVFGVFKASSEIKAIFSR